MPIFETTDSQNNNSIVSINNKHNHKTKWDIKLTDFGRNTRNAIRDVAEEMVIVANPEKKMITLTIGEYFLH